MRTDLPNGIARCGLVAALAALAACGGGAAFAQAVPMYSPDLPVTPPTAIEIASRSDRQRDTAIKGCDGSGFYASASDANYIATDPQHIVALLPGVSVFRLQASGSDAACLVLDHAIASGL